VVPDFLFASSLILNTLGKLQYLYLSPGTLTLNPNPNLRNEDMITSHVVRAPVL
jgi:hypothetical protein